MQTPDVETFELPLLSRDLLDDPLAFVAAEHDRHRAVLAFLKRASLQGIISTSSALSISEFLRVELKGHFEDERLSLHPALCSRSLSDYDFIKSIQRIEKFHADSEIVADQIGEELADMSAKKRVRMSGELSDLISEYAKKEHENLQFSLSLLV